ncbi:MAG: LuxR C-terminal-related transcriptional regulator [Actinomycetota bacterium]|nr:LuxR C-terminal-related transcriptional regulator [Actinomycetota bacterium]
MYENVFSWILTQNPSKKIIVSNKDDFFNSANFFHTIIEFIQDGVSVLDNDLIIRYVNTTVYALYTKGLNPINKKCYSVYHKRKTPCDDCPTLRTLKTKKPQMSTISYPRKNDTPGWHELFSIPVFDKNYNIILIIEYIRDITLQKYIKDNLNDIENRFKALEEQNNMLIQILNQREELQNNLENTISTNLEKFIKPSLNYLKRTVNEKDIDLVNAIINEIIYPITKKRPAPTAKFTPRELQVASLIKEGFQSKEIADKLCVTQKAVDYHRLNIRKKLELSRTSNLRTYLETHL